MILARAIPSLTCVQLRAWNSSDVKAIGSPSRLSLSRYVFVRTDLPQDVSHHDHYRNR